jgi:ribosome maturation factor RimP
MQDQEHRARKIVEDICRENRIFHLGTDIRGTGRNIAIKVTLDTEQGITLDQCQEISSEISDMFYRKDIFSEGYSLEVSSPGLDKPLEHSFEFRRNIDRDLSVEYREDKEVKNVTGRLTGYEKDILFMSVGKDILQIPVSRVKRARVKLKW